MMPTRPFERGRLSLIWKARDQQKWRGRSLVCTAVLALVLVLAYTPCCMAVHGRALEYRGGSDHVYSPRPQYPPEDPSEEAPVNKKRGGIRFSFSLFGRRKDCDQREDKIQAQPCLERQEQPHHYNTPAQDRHPHHHHHHQQQQHAYPPPHDREREREREVEAPMYGRERERAERRGYGRSERAGEDWEDRNGYGDRWQHPSHPRQAAPPNYHYNGRMVNVASAQASMQMRPTEKDGERREEQRDADEGDWTFARFRAQIRKEVEEESRRLEELEEKRHRRSAPIEEPVVKPKEPAAREREEGEEEAGGLAVAPRAPIGKPRMRGHQQEGAALDMTPEERKKATQALIHMRVHHQLHNQAMLYVSCTVNDKKVRACVDTGASTTVMSLKMARECGLMPHVDTSVVGGVKGVGFAKILGCVHDARIRLGRMEVRTRVSIIDCLSPPFVIGLDVLRHCKCDVSFRSNELVLRNNEQEEVLPFFHATEDDEPPAPHHDRPPSAPHRPPRPSQRHSHLESSPPLPRPAPSSRLSSSSLSSPLPRPPSSRSPPPPNTRHAPPPPLDEDNEEDNEDDGAGVSMAGV